LISAQTQWAVGQGFFHSGAILDPDAGTHAPAATYVYDCGTSSKDRFIDRELDEYLHSTTRPGPGGLDMVFISHFDDDHVSGIMRLHAAARPRRYVIPSVSLVGRLSIAAQYLVEHKATSLPAPFAAALANPRGWLTALPGNPDVIEVDEAADDLEGDERTAPPELFDDVPRQGDEENLVGIFTTAPRVPSGTTVGKVVTHRHSFPAPSTLWEWQVYVPHAARTRLEEFELTLRAELDPTERVDLAGTAVSAEWIGKNWHALKRSYPVLSRHRNQTSLCMYSGPPAGASVRAQRWVPPDRLTLPLGPGWLGAGDADLATERAARAFTDTFAPLLDYVGTFAIPHHGAATSWNDALLDPFSHGGRFPPVCVVGADPAGRHHHPSPHAMASVASHGGTLVVVNSDPRARWSVATLVWP
jgi:hypothetical protein